MPALRRVERGRANERLLDLVGHVDPERAGRGTTLRVGRRVHEVAQVRPFDDAPVAERLEENEREGIDVGGRADGADAVVELLRRSIRGREDLELPDGVRARAHVERAVVHQLGDAEVEHLHLQALRRVREEQVAGVEIAVGDALRMRKREAVGGGPEELHDLVDRPALLTAGAANREIALDRAPLEPLEDHVRHERAGRRRLGRAGSDAPYDVEVALREAVEDPALVTEPLHEGVDERGAERSRQLEALDRDRLVQPLVVAAVDRAEATFADELVDTKLAIEDLTDEPERVRCVHGGTVSPLGEYGAHHRIP